MTDHDQVIDLGAVANRRIEQRAAVNTGIGADLNILSGFYRADLRNLDITAIKRRKTEAVSSDNRAGMNNIARSDFAAVINIDVRINMRILADDRTLSNDGIGPDKAAGTDLGAFANNCSGFDGCGFINLSALFDNRSCINARLCFDLRDIT